MRRLLALAIATVFTASVAAGGALGAGHKPPVLAQATGDIKVLSLSRIKVDRLTCSLRVGKPSVARFVVSDPVTIGCKKGVLASIAYTPASPSRYGSGATFTTLPAAAAKPTVTSSSGVMTFGSISVGAGSSFTVGAGSSPGGVSASGTTTRSDGSTTSWSTTNASGTITALDPSSITVGGLTCSLQLFPAGLVLPSSLATFVYDRISPMWKVGDAASIGCYDGLLRVIGRAAA